jgi:hypothetical protein
MFERMNMIIYELYDSQHINLTINQHAVRLLHIIKTNNINLMSLLFEAIIYLLYSLVTSVYSYTIWCLCKPFQTMKDIQKVYYRIHYNIYPQEYRSHLYKLLFKTLIIDIIRTIIVAVLYFNIQRMFMWK